MADPPPKVHYGSPFRSTGFGGPWWAPCGTSAIAQPLCTEDRGSVTCRRCRKPPARPNLIDRPTKPREEDTPMADTVTTIHFPAEGPQAPVGTTIGDPYRVREWYRLAAHFTIDAVKELKGKALPTRKRARKEAGRV